MVRTNAPALPSGRSAASTSQMDPSEVAAFAICITLLAICAPMRIAVSRGTSVELGSAMNTTSTSEM